MSELREALIEPLREVYGVSDKVLTMTLSCILLAAPKRLHLWHEVGASMIAIDTLVHNFLVRTGILNRIRGQSFVWRSLLPGRRLRRHYRYRGPADRCPTVQSRLSAAVGRFVQHAIWRYCAQSSSTCATAIGLMIASLARTSIAKSIVIVIV